MLCLWSNLLNQEWVSFYLNPRPQGLTSLTPKLNQYNLEAITDLLTLHTHDSYVSKQVREQKGAYCTGGDYLQPIFIKSLNNDLHKHHISNSMEQRSASEVIMFSAS